MNAESFQVLAKSLYPADDTLYLFGPMGERPTNRRRYQTGEMARAKDLIAVD